MSINPSMIHLEDREESFAAHRSKSKTKPAFPLKKSEYPHLTPERLAKAGFFHQPGEEKDEWDSCQCFICGLNLGGWDREDDPFEEHARRKNCSWGVMFCQPVVNRAKGIKNVYETDADLPSSAESSTARLKTFQDWWPHDKKDNWIPTAEKMANAGFLFTSSTLSFDQVACPLCEYSVEGWEAEDDPWAIHFKKSPNCDFFVAEIKGSQSMPKAGKAVKGSSKRVVSNRSQRSATVATVSSRSEATSDAAQSAEEADETVLAASTSNGGKKGRKPRSKPKSSRVALGESVKGNTLQEESEPDPLHSKTKGRGKKPASQAPVGAESEINFASVSAGVDENMEQEIQASSEKVAPKRRSRLKKKKSPPPGDDEISERGRIEEEEIAERTGVETQGRKRGPGRPRKEDNREAAAIGQGLPTGLTQSTRPATRSASAKTQATDATDFTDVTEATTDITDDTSEGSRQEEDNEDDTIVPVPRRRGRAASSAQTMRTVSVQSVAQSSDLGESTTGKIKKPRGRPKKEVKSVQPPPIQPLQQSPPSQLERFANVPTSSPFETVPTEIRSPQTIKKSTRSKAASTRVLSRSDLDKSVIQGATEARRVFSEVILNSPIGDKVAEGDEDVKGLTELQKKMTLEQLVKSEMQKRYEAMKAEGEAMIAKWEQRTREARRQIERM